MRFFAIFELVCIFVDELRRITHETLFEKWRQLTAGSKTHGLYEFLRSFAEFENASALTCNKLLKFCTKFCSEAQIKWKKCHRNLKSFMAHHQSWLNKVPDIVANLRISENASSTSGAVIGRPVKPFDECSKKTKRRRIQGLVTHHTTSELSFAANVSAGSDSVPDTDGKCLSAREALSLYVDLDLSERKYSVLRSTINSIHPNCFPSLYALKAEKKKILPEQVKVTETTAEVDLQNLLNKTSESIVNQLSPKKTTTATLKCKYGFDGSSGHSNYKQAFSDGVSTDGSLFVIAFVPLQLVDDENGEILWSNANPSSTFYCRPVKFTFAKETSQLIKEEEKNMSTAISNLNRFETNVNGFEFHVRFNFCFTMIDGKVCSTISEKGSSTCYICGAKPKEMNLENVTEKIPNTEGYRFGLSPLHCKIKVFECLLHIAYRLPLKVWQVREDTHKAIFEARVKGIKADFKSKMGLTVDQPKPGFGSTNDGNTARKFFSNPQLSAEITGVDEELIETFSKILIIIASGHKINIEPYEKLLQTARKKYLELYGWYYMPVTMHKLLIHSADIISMFDLPVGALSEEALEAMHKILRTNRLKHTRKSSRVNTNKDLMNYMLFQSDPALAEKRRKKPSKNTESCGDLQIYFQENENVSDYLGLNDLSADDDLSFELK